MEFTGWPHKEVTQKSEFIEFLMEISQSGNQWGFQQFASYTMILINSSKIGVAIDFIPSTVSSLSDSKHSLVFSV